MTATIINEREISPAFFSSFFRFFRSNRPLSLQRKYRNTANFVSANCLCKDCDNDHSDNPDEWVTPEDVRRAFPDVPLGIHYSRNHMKSKRGKAPRPKFHCILLTDAITDHEEYKRLAKLAHQVFPYFDTRAEDAAHFFFGTHQAQVEL